MAGEELLGCHHQAAGDAGGRGHTLGNDLEVEGRRGACSMARENKPSGGMGKNKGQDMVEASATPLGLPPGTLQADLQVLSGPTGTCLVCTHPFGDSLTQVLHPVGHFLLIVGAQLQGRAVGQDHLEGVGPVCCVCPPASATLLPPVRIT